MQVERIDPHRHGGAAAAGEGHNGHNEGGNQPPSGMLDAHRVTSFGLVGSAGAADGRVVGGAVRSEERTLELPRCVLDRVDQSRGQQDVDDVDDLHDTELHVRPQGCGHTSADEAERGQRDDRPPVGASLRLLHQGDEDGDDRHHATDDQEGRDRASNPSEVTQDDAEQEHGASGDGLQGVLHGVSPLPHGDLRWTGCPTSALHVCGSSMASRVNHVTQHAASVSRRSTLCHW